MFSFFKTVNTIVTIFFFCFFLSTRGPVTETLVWYLTFYECSHFYYKRRGKFEKKNTEKMQGKRKKIVIRIRVSPDPDPSIL